MSLLQSFLESRARTSSTIFAGLALRDEVTGAPVRLSAYHREWHRIWSTDSRSVVWAPSEFGKSQQLASHVAWRIGVNPALRVGILSATAAQAQRFLRAVAIVVSGPAFARVFPGASVDRITADELTLANRPQTMKDANVIAAAFDLSSLLGARIDFAACDDIVAREATRTPPARDAAYQGFLTVTSSRVAPNGAIAVVGTAEHTDDIPHRLSRLPGWTSKRFPALDGAGRPAWPERWPIERIEQRRLELGPIGFQRAMMCVPVDESTLVFRPDDLMRALFQGVQPHFSPLGGRVILAVDPAWTTTATSDESAIVMVVIDSSGYRHLTHVEAGRLHHDALTSRVVELARANKATVYIESNGAGGVIADAIGKRVPCTPLNTSATSKRARVEALSAELASSRWAFRQPLGYPSPDLRKLVDELSMFSFESHTGDRCSALLLACEGCRLFESRPRGGVRHLDLFARF